MESSESLTELMKQAEHWGLVYPVTENSTRPVAGFQCQFCASELGSRRSQPTLNQTGELKATFWLSRRWESSAWKVAASAGVAKYPSRRPQSRMDSATRVMRARTPLSRWGVPTWPCRYLEATMLVAVMDQSEGTSTFFCSKMVRPL